MNEYLKASQNFNAIVFLYSHITGMIFVQLFIRFQLFSSENCFPKFGGHSQNISKMIGHFDGFIYFSLISVISFLYPRFPEGGGSILFYLCPSVHPSKIFFVTFFPYRGKRFWTHQIPTSC